MPRTTNQRRPKSTIEPMPDGSHKLDWYLTRQQAAKFFEICNRMSEEAGRPMSMAEVIGIMAQRSVDAAEAEAAEKKAKKIKKPRPS